MKTTKNLITIGTLLVTISSATFAANNRPSEIKRDFYVGETVIDHNLEHKVAEALSAQMPNSDITVISSHRKILLAGEVATIADKNMAEKVVKNISSVRHLWDQLTINPSLDKVNDDSRSDYLIPVSFTGLPTTKKDLKIFDFTLLVAEKVASVFHWQYKVILNGLTKLTELAIWLT